MQSRNFFSSLSRVEKRVRSETRNPDPTPSPPTAAISSSQSLLSSPLFLLSQSVQDDPFPPSASQYQTLNSPPITEENHCPWRQSSDLYGDIEALAAMLGFSGDEEGRDEGEEEVEDGFYERVAGVKGPRCGKEKRRLEGWFRHYLDSKEEPLRLIHLMMGRVAVEDAEFEFPSTVDGFLHVDPPIPCFSNQDK
ncbi:hypothetical protein MLD38_016702 [Melastoma candidum]|uniref:Uncharacterized protein n=1 Tax=Melastoma candidum TaxID=119954 RepID=A0ACB9QPI3_9MYRT|nr:hypothetical protein MLD38_016702 [Melastoma candidum]